MGSPFCRCFVLFCYAIHFTLSLSEENQTDVIEALNSTFKHLDDLKNIADIYFVHMIDQICMYPIELHFNIVISTDTEALFCGRGGWIYLFQIV